MPVSDRDQRRMRLVAAACAHAEVDTIAVGQPLAATLDWIDAARARLGLPPVDRDPDANPPERELYRRARALGMRRVRG